VGVVWGRFWGGGGGGVVLGCLGGGGGGGVLGCGVWGGVWVNSSDQLAKIEGLTKQNSLWRPHMSRGTKKIIRSL